jgi:glycolate oxidase
VKYGVTREAVLGLKVVLADGRLLEVGHRTVKGVTGYDLTALMIGSEGTLGVIVEATLRLRPLPKGAAVTVKAEFPTVERAARASSVVSASGTVPAIMEVLDPAAVRAISDFLDVDLGAGALLLAQTDGVGAAEEAAALAAVIRSLGGTVELTEDPLEAKRLFDLRRAFHPSLEAQGGTVLIEDVAVPRSALPAMFAAIERISHKYGIAIPTVAHAGDGNLHPNFVFTAPEVDGHVDVPEEVWAAADEMFLDCLRLGGTLTGEHGVGILKKRWLRDELGDDSFDLQRQIKRVFDPAGILNPGKVF